MARALDFISIGLLLLGLCALVLGMHALGDTRDLSALYWLIVGALLVRAATDLLRPKAK